VIFVLGLIPVGEIKNMTEDTLSKTAKKALITLLIQQLWPIVLSIGLSASAYLISTSMEIVSHPKYTRYSLILLATLLCTTILFLILWVKLYWQYGRFRLAFGVLWDKQLRMHCLTCHRLLKYSSQDPSILYCSYKPCDNRYVLRDNSGQMISEQEAIKRLKSSQQPAEPDAQ
jgi:hypothetical protein